MSDQSSMDEQMDDGLTIKPPQPYQRKDKDRKHSRSHRHSSKSSRNKDSDAGLADIRDRDRERHRHGQHKDKHHDKSRRERGDRLVERDPHHMEKDRSRQLKKYGDDIVERDSRQSSSSRRHGRKEDISGKDFKTIELSEAKLKRLKIELENEKALREIERRREKEKLNQDSNRSDGRSRDRSKKERSHKERSRHRDRRSPSPPEDELDKASEEPAFELKHQQEHHGRHTLEVQEIEMSSGSDLEEGEERSTPEDPQKHEGSEQSNVSSASEREVEQQAKEKVEKVTSDVSSTTSSSRKSNSDVSSSSSSSSSSESEGEDQEAPSKVRKSDDDGGSKPAKIPRHDTDNTPHYTEDNNKNDAEENNSKITIETSSVPVPAVIVTPVPEEEEDLLPPYFPALQGCRRVEEFTLLNRIEEGTYGVVYRAKEKRTDGVVALKRLKMEKEKDGFPITSLREINTLLKAQHENIVTVREIVVGSNTDKIFLVMDYVEHDLKALMETLKHKNQVFLIEEVKCLMVQLLRAVAHMHDNWILHRDLKTSNLLLSHKGILKVGDFGLAREYGSPLKGYTPIVVTLWYRAPELLLGTKEYSTPIDVWSVGCIFGELLKMEPMFPGKSEPNQLNLIFQSLGTPNDRIWPGYSQLPLLQKMTFADYPVNKLKTRFPHLTDVGIDLMNKFLTFNPAKRITADEALDHKFFKEIPIPINPEMFPTWPAKSEGGHRKGAASPKPPSGGKEFKGLKDDEDSSGFFLGGGDARRPPLGAGFSLKF